MKPQPGFTLIELAVVLTIMSLLMGGFLLPLASQFDVTKIQSTQKILTQVKEALIHYAAINNRLPCPASDTPNVGKEGVEDSNFCQKEGELPWVNLGIGKYDAWGNAFKYRIDKAYINNIVVVNRGSAHPVALTSSQLKVWKKWRDTDGSYVAVKSEQVVAIIFSYGKDGEFSSDKVNIGTGEYYQGDIVPNGYDDILVFLSKSNLIAAGRQLQNTNIAITLLQSANTTLSCTSEKETCLNNGWRQRECASLLVESCLHDGWASTQADCETFVAAC